LHLRLRFRFAVDEGRSSRAPRDAADRHLGASVSAPREVFRRPLEQPLARMQNVPMDVSPSAIEDFEHHAGYSVAVGAKARYLSAWGAPWWLAERVSAPVSGSFN